MSEAASNITGTLEQGHEVFVPHRNPDEEFDFIMNSFDDLFSDETHTYLKEVWCSTEMPSTEYEHEDDATTADGLSIFESDYEESIPSFEWGIPSQDGDPRTSVFEYNPASHSWELRQNIIKKEFDILTKVEETQFSTLVDEASLAELKSWVDLDTMEIIPIGQARNVIDSRWLLSVNSPLSNSRL